MNALPESSLRSAPTIPLSLQRSLRTQQIGFSIAAIAALLAGAGFLLYARFVADSLETNLTSLALCIVSAGLWAASNFLLKRRVIRCITEQGRMPKTDGFTAVRWFELEDFETKDRLKVLPDDMGIVWVDEATRTLHLQGMHLIYTIRSQDISTCNIIKSTDLNRLELQASLDAGPLHIVLKAKKCSGTPATSTKPLPLHTQLSNIL